LLSKDAFNIGCELADAGKQEEAVQVLSALVGALLAAPSSERAQQAAPLQDILARAQERLNAIQGTGAILPRIEYLAKQTPKEIFNLSSFSAMAAAMPTFRFTSTAVKAVLGTGIGPWLAANTIGFLAESAMFTSVGRGVRELTESNIAHSASWVQEWIH